MLIVSLDLVLVAGDYGVWGDIETKDTLCMVPVRTLDIYFRIPSWPLRMPCPALPSMFVAVNAFFDRHRLAFAWESGTDVQQIDQQPRLDPSLDQSLLSALLVTDLIRRQLETEELGMRNLMYRLPVGDVQEQFTNLAEFRRALGQPYTAIRSLQSFVDLETLFEHAVPRSTLSHEKNAAPTAADGANLRGPTNLKRFLLAKVAELEEQLDVMKEDINDEIQVAIGAVQVQDAQFMKQQT
jgi:hypothetical protein